MIPRGYITEWRNERVPWNNMHQVEQDLVIGRALIAIYSDGYLAERQYDLNGYADANADSHQLPRGRLYPRKAV